MDTSFIAATNWGYLWCGKGQGCLFVWLLHHHKHFYGGTKATSVSTMNLATVKGVRGLFYSSPVNRSAHLCTRHGRTIVPDHWELYAFRWSRMKSRQVLLSHQPTLFYPYYAMLRSHQLQHLLVTSVSRWLRVYRVIQRRLLQRRKMSRQA